MTRVTFVTTRRVIPVRTLVAVAARTAFSAVFLVACRLGGPAHEFEQPPLDATWPLPGPEAGPEAGDTTAPPDDTTNTPDQPPLEAGPGDATANDASTNDGPEETEVDPPEASACAPFVPTYCDPVHNTGCKNSRCDVSNTANTGVCVWIPGLYGVGQGCTTSAPALGFLGTDTCKDKLTCLGGTCAALCYCDADCPSGGHCDVAAGSGGFMACSGP